MVQGLKDKKIVQIASGNQHSLAMDDDGYVYAWGFAGYSRLGLQDTKDRQVSLYRPKKSYHLMSRLVPTLVPTFTDSRENRRALSILCGPTGECTRPDASSSLTDSVDRRGSSEELPHCRQMEINGQRCARQPESDKC